MIHDLRRSVVLAYLGTVLLVAGQAVAQPVTLVRGAADGNVTCPPYNARGDVIPDFSYCGFGGGGVQLPDVGVKISIAPTTDGKDDLPRLQAAVNAMAKLPVDATGFRGTLLLRRGVYRLGDTLNIAASGIVLRGEGDGETGTLLYGTRPESYFLVNFKGGEKTLLPDTRQAIADAYLPVGTRFVHVADGSKFAAGDTVVVIRQSTADWIHEIKMDRIPSHINVGTGEDTTVQWKPFDLAFDRVVTSVQGDQLTIDAPLGDRIDSKWGGGSVVKYDDAPRIRNVGIENLFGSCAFDASVIKTYDGSPVRVDEHHAKRLVGFDNATNVWARNLGTRYLEGVVAFGYGVKFATAQDCHSVEPISQITGGRRYPFFSNGQLTLWQRCRANESRHAFVYSSRVCGPNVFLDCTATHEYANSEAHHRWSVSGLYDNVHGNLAVDDRGNQGTGQGWGGANYLVWNCEGRLLLQSPPTANNFAVGFVGEVRPPRTGPANAWMESTGTHVEPRSLYLQQLRQRLGEGAVRNIAGRAATERPLP